MNSQIKVLLGLWVAMVVLTSAGMVVTAADVLSRGNACDVAHATLPGGVK